MAAAYWRPGLGEKRSSRRARFASGANCDPEPLPTERHGLYFAAEKL